MAAEFDLVIRNGNERTAHAVGEVSVADDEIEFGGHGVFPIVWFCSVRRTVCL